MKQAQDCSVEMAVKKPPSWVKHVLKNSPGYPASTFSSKRSMPGDLMIRLSLNTSFRRCRSH